MRRHFILLIFITVGLTAIPTQTFAGVNGGNLVIEDVRAFIYDSLIYEEIYGLSNSVVEKISFSDGRKFLVTQVVVNVDWSDFPDATQHPISTSKDISLITNDGTTQKLLGFLRPNHRLSRSTPKANLRKDKGRYYANFVFPFKTETKECTLQIGKTKFQFKIPAEASHLPEVMPPKIEIKQVVLLESVDGLDAELPKPNETFTGKITPVAGKILKVLVSVQPFEATCESSEGFYTKRYFRLRVEELGLLIDDDYYINAFAGEFKAKASRIYKCIQSSTDGKWKIIKVVAYFHVPSDISKFTITYRREKAAEGKLDVPTENLSEIKRLRM